MSDPKGCDCIIDWKADEHGDPGEEATFRELAAALTAEQRVAVGLPARMGA